MAGLKRARLCKGRLPISCFLTLPVHPVTGIGRRSRGCEIQVDRGDGKGYDLLTVDTTPNYVDTQSFPTSKTVWSYKAIYRADDAEVGQWSKVVSVAVGG
jgi:hypothetical protein